MIRTFYLYACPACRQHWWTWNRGVTLRDDEPVGHDCPEDYPQGAYVVARFVDDSSKWTMLMVAA